MLTDGLATAETHLSWLVMLGDRVFKAKKPVRTEFVDLTTRAARQYVLEQEVRLNRRLAPDVYLGVATLAGVAGLDEPVCVMRRMPDDRRLAVLAAAGEPLDDVVRQIAALLAGLHGRTAVVDGHRTAAAALGDWRANSAELAVHGAGVLPAGQVERVQALAEHYLGGREPLFAQRARDGRVRDGHGDLLADDVFCLPDGPRVLDCLEFDDRLRGGDVLADMAFLAMDLERLGRPELGRALLVEHRRLLADDWPDSLGEHWIAYRAQVRAKVACLRAEQEGPGAGELARLHLDLAERHLGRAQLRIVLVGGSPGTGKSTVAQALAALTGWPVLRSDVLRAELVGRAPGERPAAPASGAMDTGDHAPEVTGRVLAELLRQTDELVGSGRSVVLDATWSSVAWREEVQRLAVRTGCALVSVRAVLPDAVADERVRRRTLVGRDASDATVDTARVLRQRFAAWPEAVELDTREPASEVAATIQRLADRA